MRVIRLGSWMVTNLQNLVLRVPTPPKVPKKTPKIIYPKFSQFLYERIWFHGCLNKLVSVFVLNTFWHIALCFWQLNSYLNILKYPKMSLFIPGISKKILKKIILNSPKCPKTFCQKIVGTLVLLFLYALLLLWERFKTRY